jgi:RNA polymerase sigma-70 factor (ECF subfamily)
MVAEPKREPALASLLDSIVRGDQAALGALYDATVRQVHGLASRVLGDPALGEEVTLDVYEQVWRTAGTYSAALGTPTAWLLTIARSRAIDRLRAGAFRRRREERIGESFDAPASGRAPETAAADEEEGRMVRAALRALPPEQRSALELAYYEGLTHVEIAERLHEPLGTVKTRIRLGMTKLRELLKPIEGKP